MKIRLIVIGLMFVCIIGLSLNILFNNNDDTEVAITSFETCVAAGFPVLESAPRQCRDGAGVLHTEVATVPIPDPTVNLEPTMTMPEAQAIAVASVCTEDGTVGAFEVYNPNSGTWWFSLNAQKNGCSPACVVNDRTKEAEVNWRCTGLR